MLIRIWSAIKEAFTPHMYDEALPVVANVALAPELGAPLAMALTADMIVCGSVQGVVEPLNALAREIHLVDNWRWWHHLVTGERLDRNKGELLCLVHFEISEAMEGERKNLMDDKLPHRKMAEVELADTLIRIFDYAGAYGYDLDGAVREKRAYNAQRADHKAEARLATNGKKW